MYQNQQEQPSISTSTTAARSAISPPPSKRRRDASLDDQDSTSGAAARKRSHTQTDNTATCISAFPQPAPDWLCIYSWNINGIASFLQPSMLSYMKPADMPHPLHRTNSNAPITTSLRNFLRRHHWPQVLHLQEVKISPSDEATQRAVQRAVNVCRSGPDDGPSYTVRFCLPRDRYNATAFGRKVYGVATVLRDDFLARDVTAVREVDWDAEGRVLVVETRGRLALFNIYAVNGTANAYRSPATGAPAGTRHDRKLAFHTALLDECLRRERQGWRLVLAGDFNVAPARIDGFPALRTKPEQHVRNRADFNAKFLMALPAALDGGDVAAASEQRLGLGAVDSFRRLHPTRDSYTYMPRNVDWKTSCDRVDLILLSRALVSQGGRAEGDSAGAAGHGNGVLREADILMVEAERGPSDHFPLFVWLDLGAETAAHDNIQVDDDDGGQQASDEAQDFDDTGLFEEE